MGSHAAGPPVARGGAGDGRRVLSFTVHGGRLYRLGATGAGGTPLIPTPVGDLTRVSEESEPLEGGATVHLSHEFSIILLDSASGNKKPSQLTFVPAHTAP